MDTKKILLADDVELFLALEKTFFHRDGFDLMVAHTGLQAYDKTLAHRPDLVFMDLFMPEMDGDEACRRIKENPDLRSTPVVMVTHGGRDEDLERCRQGGCDDILLKPITRHHFLATAGKFLKLAARLSPRVTAKLHVHYGPDQQSRLTDYLVNLSDGGLFLEAAKPLPVDTPLTLEFSLPTMTSSIRCKGMVAWVNGPAKLKRDSLPSGMGIRFLDLTLKDMHTIQEFVKQEHLTPSW